MPNVLRRVWQKWQHNAYKTTEACFFVWPPIEEDRERRIINYIENLRYAHPSKLDSSAQEQQHDHKPLCQVPSIIKKRE